MARDFSDYVCIVFGGGERVRHVEHFRQTRKDKEVKSFEYNGNLYVVNKDRAMSLKNYAPWKKWDKKRIVFSLKELFRSKRIAALLYREPSYGPATPIREIRVPHTYECRICGYSSTKDKATKMHIRMAHKTNEVGPTMIVKFQRQTVQAAKQRHIIEPMHINRIHQPSGRGIDDPKPAYTYSPNPLLLSMGLYEGLDPTQPTFPPVVDMVSPRVMKAILDRPHFRRAYKSFKFGQLVSVTQKWWVWIVVAVIAVFVVLFLTGNFQVR